jgi:hypothetical protein
MVMSAQQSMLPDDNMWYSSGISRRVIVENPISSDRTYNARDCSGFSSNGFVVILGGATPAGSYWIGNESGDGVPGVLACDSLAPTACCD